ncbi:MAG: NAD-binding protein [Clostridiales bacterium]|nr:NAD-binding protein [Clostridiales bacterium]
MKIIVVGCGRMGAGLSLNLSKKGHTVTVIDSDPSAFEHLGPSFKGKTVTGIGFDRDVLIEAKIERTDALAAVTSSDEANAVIARLSSQFFKVPKVVARLYDPRKAEIYNRLGLQTIDPATWGIHRIGDLLSNSFLDTILSIGSGGVDIVEVEVPALLIGRKVNELMAPGEFQVTAISRGHKTFLPTLGTVFERNDLIHMTVTATSGDRLKALLGLS